ncbi:MAG: glycosyltransferase [Proteobacteria bacterium]|nr:glycosyltransferase [Pseudomonadota bacterium]
MSAKRVLVVIGSLDVGGAEMHLLQVLPPLAARGFEIAVHTLTGRGTLADRFEAAGIRVIAPPGSGPGPRAGGFAGRAARALRASVSLASFMREWRPAIVHFFLPEAYLAGAPVALLASDARRVMSRRSLNDYQARRPLLARAERALHGRMHALAGNSQAVVDDLAAEGAPRERLHLIRNGIDLARFARPAPRADVRAAFGTPPEALVFACVANLIGYKGHDDLIAALAAAPDLPAWELWCVGRDDGLGADLRAQAESAGISAHVRWLGPRADVPDLLAAADVGVLASHEEGFPNAVIEAMAAGLPVVATKVGGIPEAVADGSTGLLVAPRNRSALSAALARLGTDAALRRAMGDAGRARATADFGIAACAAGYARLYSSLGG